MQKGDSLLKSSRYKRFISERDKTLELILQNAQTDISVLFFEFLEQIELQVSKLLIQSDQSFSSDYRLSVELEGITLKAFTNLIHPIVKRIKRMRKATFILTYLSELEAIAQATQKEKKISPSEFEEKRNAHEEKLTLLGETFEKRIWVSLMKIRAKILEAFRLSLIQELSSKEVLEKVKQAFPKVKTSIRPPRELKPIQEADNPRNKKEMINTDFISDSDWKLAVDAYKDMELDDARFKTDTGFDRKRGYIRFDWEVSQELTDDFVNQVRTGQIEASRDLGIMDFVWVAIIDDKTDECCRSRNGLTTSEIKKALAQGKLDSSLCDAITPPAHFNCRCQIAPVASVEEVEGPDWKSFEDWLNT